MALFEADSLLDLCRLSYRIQSAYRVLFVLNEFEVFDALDKTIENIQQKDNWIEEWIDQNTFIKVECERHGDHGFNSVNFSSAISLLIKKNKPGAEFSFKESNLIVYAYILGNKGYLCIDFSGRDLSKRDYKIFQTRNSIKGTLGYCLIRISGYLPRKTLLDPFSRTGIIPIEAGLFSSKFPPFYYSKDKFSFTKLKPLKEIDFNEFFKEEDKKIQKEARKIFSVDSLLRNMKFSQKNAKIAGIEKQINFSKKGVEWLDMKFDRLSVHNIVSYPPQVTRMRNESDTRKIYSEFFYQVEYILRKDGNITLLATDDALIQECAKARNFMIIEKRKVFSGQLPFLILKLAKRVD